MPRVLALSLACPLLTIYSDVIGILGGAVIGKSMFQVDFTVYFNDARTILELKDIYGGLVKALVFGITIGAIACSQGMRAEHGAEGVGRATLRSVVLSMIFILVFNFFMTTFIYQAE
jgi:phospholipid/cholesterol/gamma-HCH transport system permease protein